MNWKKELEILKNYQKDDKYGLMICKDAEDVMQLITDQDHSGASFGILADILIRLLKEKPLFPITDNPTEWGTEADNYPGNESIQNNRCGNIFKKNDGTIYDIDRTIFVDTYDGQNSTWNSKSASDLVDEMFPIKLPYMPEDEPYYVYGKNMFLDEAGNDKTKENIGSFNYTILEYISTPDGQRIDVNKVIDHRND